MMPDEHPPQPSQGRHGPLCRRCHSELQRLASTPKRFDSPAYEIFRCARCAEVQWVEQENNKG
jgi:uncharacterized protein with PIN domain